ncbi:hypothetical protein [Streptomyces sp. NPDC001492]
MAIRKKFTTDGVDRESGKVQRLSGDVTQEGTWNKARAEESVKRFYDEWQTDATNIQFED